MKFNLNQQDLQQALNYCQGVIEKRSTLPILSNVLLEANNSKLTITATDLDLIFIHEIDNIEIEESGRTTTSSSIMYDIVRKFSAGKKINFSLSGESKLQLESEKSVFNLNCINASLPYFCIKALRASLLSDSPKINAVTSVISGSTSVSPPACLKPISFLTDSGKLGNPLLSAGISLSVSPPSALPLNIAFSISILVCGNGKLTDGAGIIPKSTGICGTTGLVIAGILTGVVGNSS